MVGGVALGQVGLTGSGGQAGDDHCPSLPGGPPVHEVSHRDGAKQVQHGVVSHRGALEPVGGDGVHQLLHGLGREDPAQVAVVHDAAQDLGSLGNPVEDPRPCKGVLNFFMT